MPAVPPATSTVSARLSLLASFALAACGGAAVETPDAGPAASPCNPLAGGASCLSPFPSAAFLVEDKATRTGYRVSIPAQAMPVNDGGKRIDPALFARRDGFSANAVIVAAFPGGVSSEGLPGHLANVENTSADALVWIVEVGTGRRVPLFAEVDMSADAPENRALLIRPLARMKPATRYAVAVRRGVRSAAGAPVPVSAAFQAILEGKAASLPALAGVAGRYPEILAALDSAGLPRGDLALAWDFVTASDESLTADLIAIRDQTVAAVGDTGAGAAVRVEDVGEIREPAHVLRFVAGDFEAPLYLDNPKVDGRGKLVRGPDGLPKKQGTHRPPFGAVIPACARTSQSALPVIVFGHGLFGNGAPSLNSGFLQRTADEHCAIFVAGDLMGLTKDNLVTAVAVAYDLNRAPELTEKLAQAVSDFMTLSRVVRGPLRDHPLFQLEGRKLVDPDRVTYYGASLGGIMGGVFMAYEPRVLRGALGVPGGNWSLLFERSLAWAVLKGAFHTSYRDSVVEAIITSMLGMLFDPVDPVTTAGRVVADPIPGTPKKQVLLYEGLGDALVTHLSTEMMARSYGIPVTGPTLRSPFGLPVETGDVGGGLTIFDEHPMPLPTGLNLPLLEDNGTHSGVNERPAVQRMVRAFFDKGVYRHPCALDGKPAPCDCATGACE